MCKKPGVAENSQLSQQLSVLAWNILLTGPDGSNCCRGNTTAGTGTRGLVFESAGTQQGTGTEANASHADC